MPSVQPPAEQYILLPARSLRGDSPLVSSAVQTFLRSLDTQRSAAPAATFAANAHVTNAPDGSVGVIDSIAETGAKLVTLTPAGLEQIKIQQPGLRVVPVQYYTPAVVPPPRVITSVTSFAAGPAIKVKLTIVSASDGAPIAGANVIAFTNFSARAGASGITNAQGSVSLALGGSSPLIDRLYVYPTLGFWPFLQKSLTLSSGSRIKLTPINPAFQDSLRFFYKGPADLAVGQGVTVGVVDTGIANHPDLQIAGGYNAVTGEKETDFGDNGEGHGTHVAGIIAARGSAPTGIRGMAPGVTLRSYRVFGKGAGGASNFDIAKAIDKAVQEGCDLLNLSLGGGPSDPALQTAINDARQAGCVVICAAGNDDRSPVSFPGAEPLALAVSALGRDGTYPKGVEEFGNVQRPPSGKDKKNYITSFSNVGPELDLTAPGDGIISTFPGGYAVLDGTSMACPAATGRVAVLLANDATIRNMPRDVNRSDALVAKILQAATPLGFGSGFEGHGLLP